MTRGRKKGTVLKKSKAEQNKQLLSSLSRVIKEQKGDVHPWETEDNIKTQIKKTFTCVCGVLVVIESDNPNLHLRDRCTSCMGV